MRTALALIVLLAAFSADAQRRRQQPRARRPAKVTVPVDVGVGPAAYLITGPVFQDQPVHFGVKINVDAVITQEWIRRNPRAIPKQYQSQAKSIKEVRISPSIFIPDALFISPKVQRTGIFGVTWRPLGLTQSIGDGALRLRLGAGLLLTYFFLYSDVLPTTHFARPGVDLGAEIELGLTENFLVSFGWSSGFYIPQQVGSFGLGPIDQSIWHLGQGFLKLHFRFPYSTTL